MYLGRVPYLIYYLAITNRLDSIVESVYAREGVEGYLRTCLLLGPPPVRVNRAYNISSRRTLLATPCTLILAILYSLTSTYGMVYSTRYLGLVSLIEY